MRLVALVLALAACVLAVADFFGRTRPLLREEHELTQRLEQALATHLDRIRKEGAPPSPQEVEAARSTVRSFETDVATLRRVLFSGAERWTDYLLPVSARPAQDGFTEERARLEQAVLPIPSDLRGWPSLSVERMGLVLPSLTTPFPSDPAIVADQTERVVAVRHILSRFRTVGGVIPRDLSLARDDDGRLVLRVDLLAGLTEAVLLYEQLLGRSEEVAPRILRKARLTRVPRSEWGMHFGDLSSPPVRLDMTLAYLAPAGAAAGGNR